MKKEWKKKQKRLQRSITASIPDLNPNKLTAFLMIVFDVNDATQLWSIEEDDVATNSQRI